MNNSTVTNGVSTNTCSNNIASSSITTCGNNRSNTNNSRGCETVGNNNYNSTNVSNINHPASSVCISTITSSREQEQEVPFSDIYRPTIIQREPITTINTNGIKESKSLAYQQIRNKPAAVCAAAVCAAAVCAAAVCAAAASHESKEITSRGGVCSSVNVVETILIECQKELTTITSAESIVTSCRQPSNSHAHNVMFPRPAAAVLCARGTLTSPMGHITSSFGGDNFRFDEFVVTENVHSLSDNTAASSPYEARWARKTTGNSVVDLGNRREMVGCNKSTDGRTQVITDNGVSGSGCNFNGDRRSINDNYQHANEAASKLRIQRILPVSQNGSKNCVSDVTANYKLDHANSVTSKHDVVPYFKEELVDAEATVNLKGGRLVDVRSSSIQEIASRIQKRSFDSPQSTKGSNLTLNSIDLNNSVEINGNIDIGGYPEDLYAHQVCGGGGHVTRHHTDNHNDNDRNDNPKQQLSDEYRSTRSRTGISISLILSLCCLSFVGQVLVFFNTILVLFVI